MSKSEWTNINDEMPDADMMVLVACPECDEPVWLGYFDGDEWRTADGGVVTVTHWMDLPEPPAEATA